jgi:hypothetical protein
MSAHPGYDRAVAGQEHRAALANATAAWLNLLGLTHAYQAAILQGKVEEAERIRGEAHDVLDANLDENAHAANATRAIIGL